MPMPPPVTLDNTIGAAFIGTIFASILYGITNIQVYSYYATYHKDHLLHKYAVALLWTLDSLHLALTITALYHTLIKNFGLLSKLGIVHWSYKLQVTVNVAIVVIVQTLYAIRAWRLESLLSAGRPSGRSLNLMLLCLVFLVIVVGYAIGITLAIKTFSVDLFVEIDSIYWIIVASFACATLVDFVLSGAMTYYLTNSKTPFLKVNNRILTITRVTLASGCVTSTCSLVCLICFVLMPNNLIFLGVEFLLTKLYINSFLAMLNARDSSFQNLSSLTIVSGAEAESNKTSVRIGSLNLRSSGSGIGSALLSDRMPQPYLHYHSPSHN